jgi:hypothetical protein
MKLPIHRIDPNPGVLAKTEDGRLLSFDSAKTPHALASAVLQDGEGAVEAFRKKGQDSIYFKVPGKNIFIPSRRASPKQGERIILWTKTACERAVVLSTSIDAAHAFEADPACPAISFRPIEFKATKIPSKLWGYAGFESVVLHQGVAYGTLAPLEVEAIAATFGRAHESGKVKVIRFHSGKAAEERTFY